MLHYIPVRKTYYRPHGWIPSPFTKDTKIDAAATNTVDLEPQQGPYPKTLSWEAKFQVPSPVCCVWWMFHTIVIHPAGWVIESGGVALLMFVDPVSLGIFQWISCFFAKFRLDSMGFIVFLCTGHQIWSFHPQKSAQFLVGNFKKECGAMVLAHESVFFFSAAMFGHMCAKVLPVRDIRNVFGSW